jgi:hypothetical protein
MCCLAEDKMENELRIQPSACLVTLTAERTKMKHSQKGSRPYIKASTKPSSPKSLLGLEDPLSYAVAQTHGFLCTFGLIDDYLWHSEPA